jgi:hypothetical protein
MNINGKHEVLAQIARQGLSLGVLLAMTLICANAGRAQSTVATASTQQTKPAVAPVVPEQTPPATAKPEASQANAPAPSEEKSSGKGQHEGITVHGHWTIDVKNPDGTRVSHRDFENSLSSDGKNLLTSLLLGAAVPGWWHIELKAGAALQSPGGPCSYTDPSNVLYTYCELRVSAVAPSSALCSTSNCFQTLTITPTPSTGFATGFTLNATAISSQAGSIGAVDAQPVGCGNPINGSFQLMFTAPNICAATAASFFGFTSTTVSPAVQVLTAGQTIAVTVQISFQ